MMSIVSVQLIELARKLQSLPSLSSSFLAGGTNLAIRLNHRKSVDIDLFFEHQIGRIGFELIKTEIKNAFGKQVHSFQFPLNENDEFIFARAFISIEGIIIKIEILQNMHITDGTEKIEGLRVASICDIGLFKLLSNAGRLAAKDTYDLDHITDQIFLAELMEKLSQKIKQTNEQKKRTIFELDTKKTPLEDPMLLLNFDQGKVLQSIPYHSSEHLEIVNGKTWAAAKISWDTKVRRYFREKGIDFPRAKGIDIS